MTTDVSSNLEQVEFMRKTFYDFWVYLKANEVQLAEMNEIMFLHDYADSLAVMEPQIPVPRSILALAWNSHLDDNTEHEDIYGAWATPQRCPYEF